ncbi:BnaC07g18130D [Brassica napus]|uniref:BnaC07g18130D protein n=1 Tax=Brassica napus TaxID=3708 RepID=A0A078IHM1_BRANA|nr:BnaC08g11030D [Brassica napus]CDY49486.1 BnaC07g18130D [Brassica napus]
MDRSGFNELQSESLKEGRQWRSRQVTSGRTSSATEASSTDLSLVDELTPTRPEEKL